MATGGLYGSSGTGALIAQPGAETPGLYGKSPNGSVVATTGSETAGLYGNSVNFGGTFFEWFIFKEAATQPATPTGGSWDFTTNIGTAPTGWTGSPPTAPVYQIWVSIAIVNSKTPTTLTWSVPGLMGVVASTTVGTTTTGAAGSSASVNNSGTSVNAVLNFTIPQGATGSTGATGATGPAGPTGPAGAGVATGGTVGQVLAKVSSTNYDTNWITPAAGTVTSVAATVPSFLSVAGSPITSSGTLALSYSGTALPVANGGTGVTASSGANSVVLRDSNVNISANSISEGFSNVAAAGTTTVLTIASAPNYVVTGSGGQTYQLPDATTLVNGANYTFNNNQSSGTIVVKNNSSTTVATVQSGGYVDVILLSNSIAAGSWDVHNFAPSNVSWSTNTLDYAGSITSATWNGNAVALNRGGTGQTTAQAAMNSFAGAVTSGSYLRGNGTNVVMSTIQAADVPTLNQSTTGQAGKVAYALTAGTNITFSSGTTYDGSAAITINATGGGGSMVYPAAGIPNSTGSAWGTSYSTTGSGTVVALATSPTFITPVLGTPTSADFSTGTFTWPTFNQNTTGTASNITASSNSTLTTLSSLSLPGSQVSGNISGNAANVTGTVLIANGGTSATTAATARSNLSAAQSGANTDITSVTLTTGTISTAPSSSTDIVNKSYADSIATGVNFHAACNYATAAALSAAYTYNNGTSGVGATITANAVGTLTIDSYTFVSGDVGKRILIKNETGAYTNNTTPSAAFNGVYTLTTAGTAGVAYVLTRATDYDTSGSGTNEIDAGDLLLVLAGTTNANTSWVQQTLLPITVGTTSLTFIQFAAIQTYTAGTGLSLTTNQFSITNTGTAGTYGSASQVPVFVTNAQGQITSVTNTSIAIAGSAVTGNISGNAANVTGTVAVGNGGTGQTTYTDGQLLIGNSTGNTLAKSTLTAGTGITVTNGSGTITIAATGGSGATITNDTTTSTNVYPLFAAATSGSLSTVYTSNANYLYKPSTGELTAPVHVNSNGIMINSTTVSANYTIATGNNGFSVGPLTVNSGVTVTISSGQRHVII